MPQALYHFILDFLHFPYPHTGTKIAVAIKSVTDEFGISEKLLSLATDNAANEVLGVERLQEMGEELDNLIHVRCICHIINLAVKEGLKEKEIEEYGEKVRYYCKRVHNSGISFVSFVLQCIIRQN